MKVINIYKIKYLIQNLIYKRISTFLEKGIIKFISIKGLKEGDDQTCRQTVDINVGKVHLLIHILDLNIEK